MVTDGEELVLEEEDLFSTPLEKFPESAVLMLFYSERSVTFSAVC